MSNSPLVTYTRFAKYHGGKRTHAPDTISIHCFVGQVTAKRGCDYFATTNRKASSNYVVGCDGSIGLSVDERNRSYCTSSSSNDNRAITIEVASDNKHPYAVTDKAYAALIDLLVDICQRNNIKKLLWKGDKKLIGKVHKQNMTVHRWFAAKACPGDYLYKRHGAIAEEVNKRLGSGGSVSTPAETPKETTTSEVKLYRIRKSWDDAKSQIGAYKSLEGAKDACREGYNVYDEDGKVLYSMSAKAEKEQLYRIRKSWADAKSQVGAFKNLDSAKSACPKGYSVYDEDGKAVYSNGAAAEASKPAAAPKLTINGVWDKATTTRLQQIFGTSVDGKVSNQIAKYRDDNPGLATGWEWDETPNGKGSQLIKAMQKWAGMATADRDGEIGPKTIKAFQKKLGTTQDGVVSKPSNMVKALQKWANEQK